MRAAVIGIGNKGWRGWVDGVLPQELTHVGAILKTPALDLVAVADSDRETWRQWNVWADLGGLGAKYFSENNNCVAAKDYQEMLSRVKPSVVTICTPPDTHQEIARNVVRYASVEAVLLEKPVAPTLPEANKILQSYQNFNVPCIVNHTRRWHRGWRAFKEKVAEYGGCYHMVGMCNGEPLDAGIHMADLFNWIAPDKPYSYIDLYQPQLGKYAPYMIFITICFCDDGVVTMQGNGTYMSYADSRIVDHYKNLLDLPLDAWTVVKYDYTVENCLAHTEVFKELAQLPSRDVVPTCSLVDGVKAVELYEKVILNG